MKILDYLNITNGEKTTKEWYDKVMKGVTPARLRAMQKWVETRIFAGENPHEIAYASMYRHLHR